MDEGGSREGVEDPFFAAKEERVNARKRDGEGGEGGITPLPVSCALLPLAGNAQGERGDKG
jgi:hypothetical protein